MYGFQKLSSMYDNLEQAAKRKELNHSVLDLQQLTAYLSNLSHHYGGNRDDSDETIAAND